MKEAPADPGLEVPSGWPRYGTLRGKRIELRVDAPEMRPADLADVIVNLPGLGESHPWRGSDYAIAEDGSIVF